MSDKNSAFHKAAEFLSNEFAEAVAPKLESCYEELRKENARLREVNKEALEALDEIEAYDQYFFNLKNEIAKIRQALQGKEE